MTIEIVTPEKTVYKEEADEILVPTQRGQIGILPHHINLVTQLSEGEIIIRKHGKEHYVAVTGGFLEVNHGKVAIAADYAAPAEDIDVEKAIAAQKRAEQILKQGQESVSQRDFAIASAELRKSILQLDVANRRRRRNV